MLINAASLTQAELTTAIVRDPLTVTPDTTVIAAIAQMSGVRTSCQASSIDQDQLDLYIEARSSCVIVLENQKLVGILTERDIVRLITQTPKLEGLSLRDVMTRDVITLYESDFTDLFFTIGLLQQYQIRHLPILNAADEVVGLLTHESLRQISRPVDLMRLRMATEVMVTDVVCADPQISMRAIAGLMTQHRVSSVMVVQTQSAPNQKTIARPIGIVTEHDVVQFQALNLDFDSCQAEAVMSSPIFSVQPDDSLWTVQQIMEQRFIRRVAVTDSQGELLGIITQSSLLKALNPLELYRLAEVLEQRVTRLEAEKLEFLESRTIELERQVEERTTALESKAEQAHLIATISSQIRSSLNLQDILITTVTQVRELLNCDRVAIWQIQSDNTILAVAESKSSTIQSQLGQIINDPYFIRDWSEAYRQGRIRVISDIYTIEMTACHRTLLEQLQTRAKILLPIIQGESLWGFLEAVESHHSRQWKPEEISLLEQLATQLAIAIQQATSYEQVQTELIERRQAEALLRESEQRFLTLAEAAPVGIFRTDREGQALYVNERWCSIAGLTIEEAYGRGWINGLHPSDRESVTNEWDRAIQENRPFQLEYRFQRPDGGVTWVFGQALAERDSMDEISAYVGTITDISDLKQAQELIVHNALYDPLTDLPNRRLLTKRIELAITRSRRIETYHYAVLFLDLDRFKVVNDSLGHLTGDLLLKTIAHKLKQIIRDMDVIARVGGDEFVVLLEDITSTEEIILIADRILADCQTSLTVHGYEVFTSLSIGIVFGNQDYRNASDLLRDADIAMYRAKEQGRNSYKFFDAEMHKQALNRLTLETDLRRALDQQELILHYQPIVDILNRRLIGFEALVRWIHPERGFVAPDAFISVAEEIGLIVALDSWVFRTACTQLAAWKQQFAGLFPLKMSINLSAQDLRQANFLETIDRTLAETGLEGHEICLEVTESILIEDINQTIHLLTQLKERKIQVSIDDFGTGYSSLNYLHRLPADNLKIDRSFVGQMQLENRNYQVVSTIIALSNQLELAVIAEGIETQQQLQWLQQLGCEFGQGYFFSKPLSSQDIESTFLNPDSRKLLEAFQDN